MSWFGADKKLSKIMHIPLFFASTFFTSDILVTNAQDALAYNEGYGYPWISKCHYYGTIETSCITISSAVDSGCDGMDIHPFYANVYLQQELCQDFELISQTTIFTDDNFPNTQTFCINSSNAKYSNSAWQSWYLRLYHIDNVDEDLDSTNSHYFSSAVFDPCSDHRGAFGHVNGDATCWYVNEDIEFIGDDSTGETSLSQYSCDDILSQTTTTTTESPSKQLTSQPAVSPTKRPTESPTEMQRLTKSPTKSPTTPPTVTVVGIGTTDNYRENIDESGSESGSDSDSVSEETNVWIGSTETGVYWVDSSDDDPIRNGDGGSDSDNDIDNGNGAAGSHDHGNNENGINFSDSKYGVVWLILFICLVVCVLVLVLCVFRLWIVQKQLKSQHGYKQQVPDVEQEGDGAVDEEGTGETRPVAQDFGLNTTGTGEEIEGTLTAV